VCATVNRKLRTRAKLNSSDEEQVALPLCEEALQHVDTRYVGLADIESCQIKVASAQHVERHIQGVQQILSHFPKRK
jgi:hypothetical protein